VLHSYVAAYAGYVGYGLSLRPQERLLRRYFFQAESEIGKGLGFLQEQSLASRSFGFRVLKAFSSDFRLYENQTGGFASELSDEFAGVNVGNPADTQPNFRASLHVLTARLQRLAMVAQKAGIQVDSNPPRLPSLGHVEA
jgi:hypothetical protein